MVDPITGGVLVDLIATAVTSVAGRAWEKFRGTPEERAVKAAIGAAVDEALRLSALPQGRAVDDAWVAEMEKAWHPVFTAEVSQQLVASLADRSEDAADRFADAAQQALAASVSDVEVLQRTFWVEEFLAVLPRLLLKRLRTVSVRDPAVRELVHHVLSLRDEAGASGAEPATPAELRSDLIMLLDGLDKQARTGLPPYLPKDADVTALSRMVCARLQVRAGPGGDDPGGQTGGGVYRLPVDRRHDSEPPRPWPQIAAEYQQLMVLADPGLGKSWLVRTETHRLCKQALDRLAPGLGPVVIPVIPVPLRCDQLAAAAGPDLASRAAGFLVAQGLLAERSRGRVAAMVRSGEAVVLLDALDELTTTESGPVWELVSRWAEKASDRARCVITSRIAGYTGSPLRDARVVELQAFTSDDVEAAIGARLPSAAAARLRARLADPATRAMARIPLLLALLCSLAAEPGGEALPATRGKLFEQVLRWFLTGAHRRLDDPGAPVRDDVEVEALLQILAPLAFTFATQPAGWTDLMRTDSLLNAIRDAGPAFTDLGRPADVLHELSVGAGVLVPDGDPSAGRSRSYLFLHRCVAEYLTALHLHTLPDADWLAIVGQHQWSDSGWDEVIPLLGELLPPDGARALIQHLLARPAAGSRAGR